MVLLGVAQFVHADQFIRHSPEQIFDVAKQVVGDSATTGEAKEKDEAEAAEITLNLSEADRVRIQQALTLLGFDTEGFDGYFGPLTRRMISKWQQAHSYSPHGYLIPAQRQALLDEAATALAKFDKDEEKRFLEVELPRLNALQDERNRYEHKRVQMALTFLGYPTEAYDGIPSAQTSRRISEWQSDRKYQPTGELTYQQTEELLAEAAPMLRRYDEYLRAKENGLPWPPPSRQRTNPYFHFVE